MHKKRCIARQPAIRRMADKNFDRFVLAAFAMEPIGIMIHGCFGMISEKILENEQSLATRGGIEKIQVLPCPIFSSWRRMRCCIRTFTSLQRHKGVFGG